MNESGLGNVARWASSVLLIWTVGVPQRARVQEPVAAAVLGGQVLLVESFGAVPVRRARVTATSESGTVFRADTDTDGRYRFSQLTNGRYVLDVSKAGFYVPGAEVQGLSVSGTPIEIRGSSLTKNIVVERGGWIEGRVAESSGNPVRDVVVQARHVSGDGARRATSTLPVRTDDRGYYRLHSLPAGEYLIEAAPRSRLATTAAPRAAENSSATYYPGVTRMEDAKTVSLLRGGFARGIDFTFLAQASPVRQAGASPAVASQSGSSRIVGRVRTADGGRPIEGGLVTATALLPPFDNGRRVATTDAQGRFSVTVPAGTYQLRATASGFIDRTYGWTRDVPMGRRIELAESQSFEAADILLPTAGAIEGRVVDEFGDPAPGILVRLATTEFLAGATRLVPAGTTVLPQPTDDRGQFRIFGVPPGEYYAMALSGPFVQGSDASGFGVTLYPGTRSGPDARPIRVASGADTVGVDFALIAVPGSSVRGVVNTQDNIPISGASVSLMPMTGGDVRIWAGASTIAAADGSFVLPYIPEGTYAIRAVGRVATSDSPAAVMEGYLTVDIKGASPATVRIEARPRSTLRGRIVFDGEAPYPSVSDVQLDVLPMDFVSSPVEALVRIPRWSDDNSFTLGNLVGRSVIRAQVRPGSWIVSRVMLDHQDITDVPLDFGHGDISNVEIVLRRTGASVSGTVSDRGQPAEEYTVVVFSEDPLKWTWPSRFVMLGWRNQHGGYRVTGLSPGAYRAIALSQVPGRMWTSPEFLREAFASASPFRVLEGEGLTLPLRLVVR